MEKLNDIAEMITTYTDQIERYECLSTWYAAFSAACIVLLFGCAVHLILQRDKKEDGKRTFYNGIIASIFMFIPTIVTLYLYVFAMNMRKVALYRGYLNFLETQWNVLSGLDIMQFDKTVISDYFSFQSFLVNGLGPAVMAIFIILTFTIAFGLSAFYLKKMESSKIKALLTGLLCILLAVCISFSGLCTYYLSINDSVVESVTNHCLKLL